MLEPSYLWTMVAVDKKKKKKKPSSNIKGQ